MLPLLMAGRTLFIRIGRSTPQAGRYRSGLRETPGARRGELSRMLKIFTTLLEPAIIIVMAIVVGGIVISILMAVFDITSGIGK